MTIPARFSRFFYVYFSLAVIPGLLPAQIRFSGKSHLEYSYNKSDDVKLLSDKRRNFFDNWTEGNWQYRHWRLGLRLEMHNSPQIYAPDQSINKANIAQRFLEYDTGNLNLRAGNFYGLFGRGLVLRFYENRQLRHDTRIDGIKLDYFHSTFDAKLIWGQPINRENERQEAFQAAELKLKPFEKFHLGGSALTTQPVSAKRVKWGAFFSEINLNVGSFYGEYAWEDNPDATEEGKAIYLNTNLFVKAFSLVVEYKNYDRFEQFEGVFFNNPPLVAREHSFTLFNRHQLIQNADDEKGFSVEASYPVIDDGVVTAHYSQTKNQNREKLYEEYYGQFDWTTPFDWEWLGALGRQQDPSARYLNFVSSTSLKISDYNSAKVVYEHQHTKRLLNDQQFYDQALTLSFSHAPNWTLSLLGERTTEHDLRKDYWLAMQLDLSFWKNFDLSLFAGSRRKGKICAGGVCVIKPALEGFEATLITRF